MHPAKSNESPFTTSQKFLVHLERQFHSNLSLQNIYSAAHLHGVTMLHDTVYRRPQRPYERLSSLRNHVLSSIRTIYSLHVTLLGRGWCRLASRGPGKPYTHDTSPAHANSLSVTHYPFSWLALLLFDSTGHGTRRFSCRFRREHDPRVELGDRRSRI